MNNHTIVRKYRESDRQSIREIACDTAFLGDPVEHFFEGRGFIADFLTAYFTDYEPQSCFVAETENKIVGYIIGTKNTKKMSRTFAEEI